MGGFSPERDASVRAGDAIASALRQAGRDARVIFVDRELDLALRQAPIDIAFLCLRGRYATDGCLQGLLEMLGLPYTGSGVLASGLAMHRAKTKEILRLANLPTAPGYTLHADSIKPLAESHGAFGFPAIVRPVGILSPLGAAMAQDEVELEAAVEDAFALDEELLIERHIDGRPVCVAVLDGIALGATETPSGLASPRALRSARRLGPSQDAATPGSGAGRLSGARYHSILRLATAAYEALGCEGAACVEMIVSDRLNEVIVGIDAAPLLTPTAPFARIAQNVGLKFADLVEEILKGARVRAHGHRHNRRGMQTDHGGPERRASGAATAAH